MKRRVAVVRAPGEDAAGRASLSFVDHGSRDGRPVLDFHGTPSAHPEWRLALDDERLRRLGVRVVAIDRPGCGRSSFQLGRRVSDWPLDVAAVADALQLERFAVLGHSGGGPYALACALALPERLTGVGVVSCVGPHDRPELVPGLDHDVFRLRRLSLEKPRSARMVLRLMAASARPTPKRFVAQMLAALPEPDRRALEDADRRLALLAAIRESLRDGPCGGQHDFALMSGRSEIDPGAIATEVHLWHGELDRNATPAMGRYLAEAIPACNARFLAGEGHISTLTSHTEAILDVLVSL